MAGAKSVVDREKEVLLLAKEGKTANEIAKALYLSPGTVRNYISEVLTKLDAKIELRQLQLRKKRDIKRRLPLIGNLLL